ncbi:uncharacterized protein FFC1_00560 [Fusarium fujikuroi]|nr:uncharacterized protein FFC1_00560 [Fusarium fujikuroi]
MASLPFNIIYF